MTSPSSSKRKLPSTKITPLMVRTCVVWFQESSPRSVPLVGGTDQTWQVKSLLVGVISPLLLMLLFGPVVLPVVYWFGAVPASAASLSKKLVARPGLGFV